jgi:uncharacterized membrane-anchored protein YhcB (DUF1043 family)
VFFQVGLEQLTWGLRFLAVIAPIVVGLVVYRLAIEQRRHALVEART